MKTATNPEADMNTLPLMDANSANPLEASIARARAGELEYVRQQVAEAIAAAMILGRTYHEATAEAFAYCDRRWPNLTAALIARFAADEADDCNPLDLAVEDGAL